MDGCWARCLGDCEGKLSREHLVSQALFPEATIRVFGFPWCPEEGKTIGIDGLASKILCTVHNNRLSEVDAAGGDSFIKFKTFLGETKPGPLVKLKIDGFLLERWFLKTTINICRSCSELRIGKESKEPGYPSRSLVRTAFGLRGFREKSGLFIAYKVGDSCALREGVGFFPLFHQRDQYVGAGCFNFGGLNFLICFNNSGLPDKVFYESHFNGEWDQKDLMHRPINFNRNHRFKPRIHLKLLWD
jgi:hypothetical protein